jgi:hypothetical protein
MHAQEKKVPGLTWSFYANLGVNHPLFNNMTEQPYGVDLAMKTHKKLGAAAEFGIAGEYRHKFGCKATVNFHGFSFDHDAFMKAMEARYTGLDIDDDRNGDPTNSTVPGAASNGLTLYGYRIFRKGRLAVLPLAGVQVNWVKFASTSYAARESGMNYFNKYLVNHKDKVKLLYSGGIETRFYYTNKTGGENFLSFTAKVAGNKIKSEYKVTQVDWQGNKFDLSFSYTTPFLYTTFLIGIGTNF